LREIQPNSQEELEFYGLLREDGTPWGAVFPIEALNYAWLPRYTEMSFADCCEQVDVELPLGRARGCWQFRVVGGSGWSTTR